MSRPTAQGATEPSGASATSSDITDETRAELLSRAALTTFRANGQFLSVAERLASPAGLTAAWWQVLGAVLREPLPVAGIARTMGITRQSVQRIADLLVTKGLAVYVPNPAHRRAKLLTPSTEGRAAIDRITPEHRKFARELADAVGGTEKLAELVIGLEQLSRTLDTLDSNAPTPLPGDAHVPAPAAERQDGTLRVVPTEPAQRTSPPPDR